MIPEIDVRACVARQIYEGTLSFSFQADDDVLDIPFARFRGDVQAVLDWAILTDNRTVEAHIRLAFTLEGACSRCLAEASEDIVYEADASFVPGGDDGEEYAYAGGKVVLKEFLRDSLVFALPSRLLCKPCAQWEKE